MTERDEHYCKNCRKSMVDFSGICINCGFDTHENEELDTDYDSYSDESFGYEDEDISPFVSSDDFED